MYNCEVCRSPTGPGVPLNRWPIYRRNGEIARELSVCPLCHNALAVLKVPLPILIRQQGKPIVPSRRVVAFGTEAITPKQAREAKMAKFARQYGALEESMCQTISACDVCGKDAVDGQQTANSVLCASCLRKAQQV